MQPKEAPGAAVRISNVVKPAKVIRLGHSLRLIMRCSEKLPGFIPMKFKQVAINQSLTSVVIITAAFFDSVTIFLLIKL